MPEKKYMLHSAKDCTGMGINRNIKDGMGRYMGSRAGTLK